MSLQTIRLCEFGNFRLDLAEKVLLRDGKSVPVTPKVFETLCVLVERAGHLVEKDELMQKLWQDRFVAESNLTFNIKMLRKALGDSASKPVFIETVPCRGYRFIAEVRRVEAVEEGEEERFGETETDAVASKISSSTFLHFSPSRLPPNNLTPSLSTIIGREKEIAEIRNLLSQNSARILTMTGVGGTGKTTLAQAVAQEELASFKDGVFFVELAAVTNPELVASTIAQTLDVKETGGKPIFEILENHLRGRQMLLVLDNFEQVLTAAPVLTKLVQAAPDLKILVTSRARIHLSSDCEFVVPPLAVPESAARISLEELSEYESIKLFVERARAVKPNFALREENARSVAEICLRLDGLPLAIELAAYRVRIIAPASILEKLGNRLKLLTGGAKDLPDRQQTVRGMVEWSYELLETDEKTLFRRLAIFAGGFTFEAAEAVGANYESNEYQKPKTNNQIETLDGITSLLDGSLLVQKEQANGESRFRMLEVVREYALEVLETSDESENMRRNHAGYFLALGEEAEPHLLGERSIEWLEKIDREHNNLRAALRWAIDSDAETARRLTGALWTFWCIRGHLREGREMLEKSLAAPATGDEPATTAHWKCLNGAGFIAYQQGDYPAAQKFFEQGLQIAEATGERRQIALSSRHLGVVVNLRGDATRARRFYKKSLRLGRELNDEKVLALSHAALADLARTAGDYEAAQQLYGKTFRSFQAINNRDGMSATLCNLGAVAFALGDFAAARASYAQAVEAALKLKNKVYVSWALDGFAALAAGENDCELAARLAGAIENLRDSIGYELEAADRSFRDAYLTKTRRALGDARFARVYEAGRAIDLDEAVALAAPKVLTNGHHFKQNESENDGNQTQISKPVNAYQAYQLARYHFQQMSPPDIIKSRALLEEAVQFDADFAPAHAALAEQSVFEVIVGLNTPAENFPKAKDALRRAADLNPHSAEFYAAAGYVDLVCDWNFTEAERNLRKALELNSHYVFANNYLGHVFMFQRLPEEAEFYLRRTVEIEPMGLYNRNILTIAYFFARNYQKVIAECEKTLAVYPRFFIAAQVRCWALEQTGRAAEAVVEYKKILREPSGEIARRWMGYAYALVGERANALDTAACLVAESREHFVSPTHLAMLYGALNETDKACFYLENALAERDPWMLWIAADPRFDNLRLDSRFDKLVRRVGLK